MDKICHFRYQIKSRKTDFVRDLGIQLSSNLKLKKANLKEYSNLEKKIFGKTLHTKDHISALRYLHGTHNYTKTLTHWKSSNV